MAETALQAVERGDTDAAIRVLGDFGDYRDTHEYAPAPEKTRLASALNCKAGERRWNMLMAAAARYVRTCMTLLDYAHSRCGTHSLSSLLSACYLRNRNEAAFLRWCTEKDGVDLSIVDGLHGRTALHFACEGGRMDAAKVRRPANYSATFMQSKDKIRHSHSGDLLLLSTGPTRDCCPRSSAEQEGPSGADPPRPCHPERTRRARHPTPEP